MTGAADRIDCTSGVTGGMSRCGWSPGLHTAARAAQFPLGQGTATGGEAALCTFQVASSRETNHVSFTRKYNACKTLLE